MKLPNQDLKATIFPYCFSQQLVFKDMPPLYIQKRLHRWTLSPCAARILGPWCGITIEYICTVRGSLRPPSWPLRGSAAQTNTPCLALWDDFWLKKDRVFASSIFLVEFLPWDQPFVSIAGLWPAYFIKINLYNGEEVDDTDYD